MDKSAVVFVYAMNIMFNVIGMLMFLWRTR